VSELTDEMKAFLKALEAPMLEMAQAAITKVVPAKYAGPATVVLDAVDQAIHVANPSVPAVLKSNDIPTANAEVVADPIAALTARVSALETHVAALTIATGHDTSAQMVAVKSAVQANVGATVN
jgi:hypothetical protein